MAFTLFSPAFAKRSHIPAHHTCDGDDLSPPLEWSDPPEGTRSFALVVADPDAPKGTWYHWGIFDIPAGYVELPEAFPHPPEELDAPLPPELAEGIRQARNSFGRVGWNGPCPPHFHHVKHHYRFHLMALDVEHLDLPDGVNAHRLEKACEAHVIGETILTGIYHR